MKLKSQRRLLGQVNSLPSRLWMIGFEHQSKQVQRLINIGPAKTLSQMLQIAYPQREWKVELLHRINRPVKAAQREVILAVQKLFPTHSTYLHIVIKPYLE